MSFKRGHRFGETENILRLEFDRRRVGPSGPIVARDTRFGFEPDQPALDSGGRQGNRSPVAGRQNRTEHSICGS